MTQKYRCDNCEKPFPEDKLIRIKALRKTWFRCKECRNKYISGVRLGDKPRDDWYYIHLQIKHTLGGLEDMNKIIRFNP